MGLDWTGRDNDDDKSSRARLAYKKAGNGRQRLKQQQTVCPQALFSTRFVGQGFLFISFLFVSFLLFSNLLQVANRSSSFMALLDGWSSKCSFYQLTFR